MVHGCSCCGRESYSSRSLVATAAPTAMIVAESTTTATLNLARNSRVSSWAITRRRMRRCLVAWCARGLAAGDSYNMGAMMTTSSIGSSISRIPQRGISRWRVRTARSSRQPNDKLDTILKYNILGVRAERGPMGWYPWYSSGCPL
jgi:hypothetical protein